MNNIEFSELASKKLAPLRHDGFERASFKYFLESGTVNASFLQLIKELCDDYHKKILNEETLESEITSEKFDQIPMSGELLAASNKVITDILFG